MLRSRLLVWIIFTFSSISQAKWLCEEAASQRSNEIITTCGIGESKNEDEARKKALKNAFKELDLVCNRSADCRDFELNIEPLRNDCQKKGATYKCYRAVNAEITRVKKKSTEKTPEKLVKKAAEEASNKKQVESKALERIDQLIQIFTKKEDQEQVKVTERFCDYPTDKTFSMFSDLTSPKKITAAAKEAKKIPFRGYCLRFHSRLMGHLNRHSKRSPVYEKFLLSQVPGLTAAPKDQRFEMILNFFSHYGPHTNAQFDLFFEFFQRSNGRAHYRTSGLLFHPVGAGKELERQKKRLDRYIDLAQKGRLGRPVYLSSDQSFIYLSRGLNQSRFKGQPQLFRYMMNKIKKSHDFKDTRSWTTQLKRFFFQQESESLQEESLAWLAQVLSKAEPSDTLARFYLDFVREFSRKISKLDDEEDDDLKLIKKWQQLKEKFLKTNAERIDRVFAKNDKKHLTDDLYDFCLDNRLDCPKTLPSQSKIKKMLKSKKYQKRLLALNILSKKPKMAKALVEDVFASLKEGRKKKSGFYRIIKPSVEVLLVSETNQPAIVAEMLDVSWDRGFSYEELAERMGARLVPELLKHINKSRNQLVAIRMLGQIGPLAKKALPELKKLATDKSHYSVRDAAQKSIDLIEKP